MCTGHLYNKSEPVVFINVFNYITFSWMLLGRKRGSSSGSLVKEDEMAVWSGKFK